MLPPLLEDVQVREYQGRFKVQLEIPSSSTLTETEIDTILAISSWEVDPNTLAHGYEGGRGILLQRERPGKKRGILLPYLQIGGIGYRPLETNPHTLELQICDDTPMVPPCSDNFMKRVSGTLGAYAVFRPRHQRPTAAQSAAYRRPLRVAQQVPRFAQDARF